MAVKPEQRSGPYNVTHERSELLELADHDPLHRPCPGYARIRVHVCEFIPVATSASRAHFTKPIAAGARTPSVVADGAVVAIDRYFALAAAAVCTAAALAAAALAAAAAATFAATAALASAFKVATSFWAVAFDAAAFAAAA